ncbi:MAG: UDP-3-O-acyl-N-acetylglucosamine deacetylase [Armatimonadetes bacterium]|nr:UDP-3-O-acyl-N-acetylglucosamine deacetylase [Armatimonadota bacterium]
MIFKRRTISEPIVIEGLGLHSGIAVEVQIHPSEDGLWFRSGRERIEAIPENVSDTKRCTRLGSIGVIEHLMSALAAFEITDVEVELSSPELPGLDGSASGYCAALARVELENIEDQEMEGLFARIYEKGEAHEIAIGRGDGHLKYVFETGDRFPGTQVVEVQMTCATYASEIAPARTIAFDFEVEPAKAAGLGLGLDENSCLVLGPEGYLNASRFPDEPARHKLLDLIGDLWLARVPLTLLNIVAEKSGHTANVAVAHKLSQAVRRKS